MIGVLDNNLLHDFDACSLIALRAVNAVGAPSCLYYAYYRCQQLLSQVSFNHSFDHSNINLIAILINCCQNVKILCTSKNVVLKL